MSIKRDGGCNACSTVPRTSYVLESCIVSFSLQIKGINGINSHHPFYSLFIWVQLFKKDNSTYRWYHTVFIFLLWLISLSMMVSSSSMLSQMAGFPHLWVNNKYSMCLYATYYLHLGCFHILVIRRGSADIFLRVWFHFLWIHNSEVGSLDLTTCVCVLSHFSCV